MKHSRPAFRILGFLPLLCLQACLLDARVGSDCLQISELMSTNASYAVDADHTELRPDWIELCNVGDLPVDANWYSLRNHDGHNPEASDAWPLPQATVAPGACALVLAEVDYFNIDGHSEWYANFDLGMEVGYVELMAGDMSDDACSDQVWYPWMEDDEAYVRQGDEWVISDSPSPGTPNP